jgi:hypothetical protein
MLSRECRDALNMRMLFLATVFVAQTCALQFFPIYLKYLNFSAIQVGIIRASQTWISMLLVPIWLLITKRLQSSSWKRVVIFAFLVVNITLHLCLTFIPQSNILQNVTHCRHSPAAEHAFLPVTLSDVSSASTVRHKLEVLNNDEPSTGMNKNTSSSIWNETEFTQTPIFKEINDSSALKTPKPITTNISIHGASNNFKKLGNHAPTLTSQYMTQYNNNSIKVMSSPLNSSLPKINSEHNKLLLNKKLVDQSVNIHKIWHSRTHSSQSRPWNAHSNKKLHYLKHSEEGYVPVTSESNKADDTKFSQTWLPKHAVIPSVQHKNVRKYYDQGSSFSGSQATSDYSKTRNVEDSFSDEQTINRLQANIAAGMEDPVESPQESKYQINVPSKPAGVRPWKKHQSLPQFVMQYKSGRKTKAGHEKNSSPISGEVNNLLAVKRIHRNMKQDEGFDPQDRHLRRKHISRSDPSESQEGEQFSRNVMKNLTVQQPVWHAIKHYSRNNTIHIRHETSQYSPFAKTLNYNEKSETKDAFPMQGTVRRLVTANSSESEHYDNDTDLQVDKVIMPQSDKNTSVQLWNIVTINKLPNYLSTTFITILLLATLACVLSRAITITSNRFLQCETTVKASSNMALTSAYQHVLTLLGWGVFGCPLLAVIVLTTKCSYQPRVFLLFSTGLLAINLLVLFLLQKPGENWKWKLQAYKNEEKKGPVSFLQR